MDGQLQFLGEEVASLGHVCIGYIRKEFKEVVVKLRYDSIKCHHVVRMTQFNNLILNSSILDTEPQGVKAMGPGI